MLSVIKISWIDEAAEEAEVTISDRSHIILCFAYPWKGTKLPSDTVFELLDSVVMATSENTDYIQREGATYQHHLYGILLDRNKRLIKVGGLMFHADCGIPGDIGDNQRVEVTCDRVSI